MRGVASELLLSLLFLGLLTAIGIVNSNNLVCLFIVKGLSTASPSSTTLLATTTDHASFSISL